jgi:hypothetical protein
MQDTKKGDNMKNKKYHSIFFSLILIIVFFSGCTENETITGDVEIISITRSPEYPNPGDVITITVTVKNCTGVHFNWDAYFTGGPGSQGMTEMGATEYEAKIGPYDNGTEVWYIVTAEGHDDTYILSDIYEIQIGEVERSDITTLSISNVLQSPPVPTTQDSSVTISADVSSNVNLTNIRLGYLKLGLNGGGSGSMNMDYVSENTYDGIIFMGDINEGATIIYRIAARDESGNTAVSYIFSIEL